MDRTNVRQLDPDAVAWGAARPWWWPTCPSSRWPWSSPALVAVATPGADFVLMVKPQFEVGRDRVGEGGVVRDPALRGEAVATIAARAYDDGLGVLGVTASPLPGPAGNVEYFLWLRSGAPALDPHDLNRAIEEGPS